jgi:hypothetical protein
MARADPTSAFRGYQDEVWELIRGGEPLAGVADAIEETDLSDEKRLALWLLAFSLTDAERHFEEGLREPGEVPDITVRRSHLSLVA